MKTSSDVTTLVNQIPELDGLSRVTGPEWPVAEEIVQQILSGGKGSIDQVVGMLVPPGKKSDCRPRYVLHTLAVYVCHPPGDAWQRLFEQAMVSHLSGDLPKPVQAFLIQQLQVAGTSRVADPLGRLLLDPALCEDAARTLLVIGEGAVEQFRKAASEAEGACLLTIVQALGVLRDSQSTEVLRQIVKNGDHSLRLAALEALAKIGAPAAVDDLLQAMDQAEGYERVSMVESCFVLAERFSETGHKRDARRIYAHLQQACSDPTESYLRKSAARAMAGIE